MPHPTTLGTPSGRGCVTCHPPSNTHTHMHNTPLPPPHLGMHAPTHRSRLRPARVQAPHQTPPYSPWPHAHACRHPLPPRALPSTSACLPATRACPPAVPGCSYQLPLHSPPHPPFYGYLFPPLGRPTRIPPCCQTNTGHAASRQHMPPAGCCVQHLLPLPRAAAGRQNLTSRTPEPARVRPPLPPSPLAIASSCVCPHPLLLLLLDLTAQASH